MGGCDLKKMRRSLLCQAQTEWFPYRNAHNLSVSLRNHPARLIKRRRATPPNLGGVLEFGRFAVLYFADRLSPPLHPHRYAGREDRARQEQKHDVGNQLPLRFSHCEWAIGGVLGLN